MKEATGELNMTVIVVIAVGVLAAFFYTIIWPVLKNNMAVNTKCADAICYQDGTENASGRANCIYYGEDGTEASLVCPWKG